MTDDEKKKSVLNKLLEAHAQHVREIQEILKELD